MWEREREREKDKTEEMENETWLPQFLCQSFFHSPYLLQLHSEHLHLLHLEPLHLLHLVHPHLLHLAHLPPAALGAPSPTKAKMNKKYTKIVLEKMAVKKK